ncbi:hypothetical protein M0805_002156 [Coniferiporia weirii]|nr:hypothetical protein M0805_002156 [Coniferiporia weirii]
MMDRSSDTTTLSPTPFSPFSSVNSCGSEGGTSDEPADLGQLAAVFEVLRTEFQPRTQPPTIPRTGTPTSSLLVSPSDGEGAPSTSWSRTDSIAYSDSDGDYGENGEGSVPGDALDQPSLGYLDGVLGFLAAERAKLTAQREAGARGGASSQSQASTSESAWRHVIEPRRKRRRKRGKQHGTSTSASGTHADDDPDAGAEGAATPVGDVLEGSSSGEHWSHGKSMPATPPHGTSRSLRRGKGLEPMTVTVPGSTSTIPVHPKLSHSRSTPSLRVTIPAPPPDARVLRLRTLATKLRMLFVDDARTLSSVLLKDVPEVDGFIDPRGRPPEGDDPPVHVFIDHSNILVGFLNHLRRYPIHGARRTPTHLSHAALALVLERGRPVSRRVLATSSPLYQPMEGAERLGYEVRVYARVPDLSDGIDRTKVKRNAAGNANGDSDPGPPLPILNPGLSHSHGQSYGHSQAHARGQNHSRSTSLTMPTYAHASPGMSGSPSGRIRFREQGVDELLQLKLHQALADTDAPPPRGATIVLATGDGNAGQFNADGFRGAVRTALRKGWHVELYAWEYGLSKAWMKEFGGGGDSGSDLKGKAGAESLYGDRFRIIGLEKFAQDLLEI